MFKISHRGNLNGKNPVLENNPKYIIEALNKGFSVEIDIWFLEGNFYLGHDEPLFKIESNFLENPKLWCHAKNLSALTSLRKLKTIYFWHQEDDFTLTSNGYIWTYPNKELSENSICVLPERDKKNNFNYKNYNCSGICSDFIEKFN